MQLIQPVTDALGTLGSGQLGHFDPSQILSGISQALESAGQSVQQAMSSLGGAWQGTAATAAAAKTGATLAEGSEVAGQADGLSASVSTAAATVAQAQAQLIAIIDQFTATMAAIGPNIIFPWGMAAAMAAANHAVTSTSEVMSATQGALSAQSAQVSAVGAPVAVSPTPPLSTNLAAMTTPMAASTANVGSALTPAVSQGIGPLLQMATSLASPVGEGVGIVTQAVQGAAQSGQAGSAAPGGPGTDQPAPAGVAGPGKGAIGGGGGMPAGGLGAGTPQSRAALPMSPSGVDSDAAMERGSAVGSGSSAGMGAGPMMSPTALGRAGSGGSGSGHKAASFLHTSDQGDDIVGDLGSVAPPVVGQVDASEVPDVELRL